MFNRTSPAVLALLIAACSDDLPTGTKPSSTPAAIAIQSGDGQSAIVARSLADPIVVKVTDGRGRPVRNAAVWFEIGSGSGAIVGGASNRTDSLGLARATWRLGTSTAADQVAVAHVLNASGAPQGINITFHATSLPDAAWTVEIPTLPGVMETLPEFTSKVVALAYDAYRNPVPDVTVKWAAPVGGTLVSTETVTGADGSTENEWTVRASSSSELGAGAYWITASIQRFASVDASTALYSMTVGDARLAATSLAAGGHHSCAVAEGEVYCWGDNTAGQLGDGGRQSRQIAMRVQAGAESFTQVVAGSSHTCALTSTGSAYCWGANGDGQLGDGTRLLRLTPVAVDQPAAFVSLTAGTSHTCGITAGGVAYCWGSNADGQLGDGTTDTRLVPNEVAGGSRFASLTAGPNHTCGLTDEQRALCWGNDDVGQVGATGEESECRSRCITTPSLVTGSFIRLSAGLQYTCGVEPDGSTWCWGSNLAQRTKVELTFPITNLVAGRATDACGLTDEGRAYCWTFYYDDYYYYYEAEISAPEPIGGARMFSALALGDAHACGLERDVSGRVVCWNARFFGSIARTEPAYVQRAGRP